MQDDRRRTGAADRCGVEPFCTRFRPLPVADQVRQSFLSSLEHLGADVLDGGLEDDLLVGGTTDHDANLTALDAILAEWADVNTSATRRIAFAGMQA